MTDFGSHISSHELKCTCTDRSITCIFIDSLCVFPCMKTLNKFSNQYLWLHLKLKLIARVCSTEWKSFHYLSVCPKFQTLVSFELYMINYSIGSENQFVREVV